MLFIVKYQNQVYHLYEFYYDIKEKKYVQLFGINKNYDIILKYENKKVVYAPAYLKNIIPKIN